MKLKKLLELDFMVKFKSTLETEFEKELFIASLRNYASHGNPLRFHNFAYTMRELILHVIARKAPEEKVIGAPWYVRIDPNRKVTRKQQLKYCAQKNIPDSFLGVINTTFINDSISDFLAEFVNLNKYTHITEKYFKPSPKQFFENARDVVSIAQHCLDLMADTAKEVICILENEIDSSVRDLANESLPDEVTILAPRVYTEYVQIEDVYASDIDDEFIYIGVDGSVFVTQEYGPKDDLCEINTDYPFSLSMQCSLRNPAQLTITSKEIEVDTSSWYE